MVMPIEDVRGKLNFKRMYEHEIKSVELVRANWNLEMLESNGNGSDPDDYELAWGQKKI
jgi:hypothetical protein